MNHGSNTASSTTNHLAQETSPYLLQHADNPVDWYPWGQEALNKARQENKPILLSIGYSACHWCHVMAHESFEDPDTAVLMNQHFVNIKVDREERPDLDKIYQTAHQLLAKRAGGWPLTMFLMPEDQQPFWGGTYFPNTPRYNMPSFKDILQGIAQAYQQKPDDVREQANAVTQALHSIATPTQPEAGKLSFEVWQQAVQQLRENFDQSNGGFGRAPKFPHLTNIELLLRHAVLCAQNAEDDGRAQDMALFTLRKMALGGINDQLGGGFCRYSVDDLWMIPHFEKMLYDNGPFLSTYAYAWQITGEPLFQRSMQETADWVLREMQSPEGGFYSALDADSEGEEGRFYVWKPADVQALFAGYRVDDADYALFAEHYGLDRAPNFEGQWHLHVYVTREALANKHGLSLADVDSKLDMMRALLLSERNQRVWPGRDDKILTSWNALMIKGLAIAARMMQEPEYEFRAKQALNFIRTTLWQDGRLLATYKDGKAHLNAYLDDYAYLLDAILQLLQTRWDSQDLQFAIELADVLLANFEDKENGGFFFTASDHEHLIQRPKPFMDEAMPSGNGVAAHALGQLGHLLGETRYVIAAENTLKAAWASIQSVPYAHDSLLFALQDEVYPSQSIILRGTGDAMESWQQAAQTAYQPQRLCFAIPRDAENLPPALAERRPSSEHAVLAYVCQGTQCLPPIETKDRFLQNLKTHG